METIVLGAGGFMPDPDFPVPGFVVRNQGVNYLLDAGEGTQTRLAEHRISRVKLNSIFISHMHGDHTLGLPGVLIRRGQESGETPLYLFGPPELEDYVEKTSKFLQYKLHYELRFRRLEDEELHTLENVWMGTKKLDHRLENYGFVVSGRKKKRKFHPEQARELDVPEGPLWGKLQDNQPVTLEDGREIQPEQVSDSPPAAPKVVYITDTRPVFDYPRGFYEPDLLIHEGMFLDEHRNQAVEKKHSTAREAAAVAEELNADQLLLTHFSRRYDNPEVLAEEAAEDFPRVDFAQPGQTFSL